MTRYLRYLARFGRHALRHPVDTTRGYREGLSMSGWTYGADPYHPRSVAYDVGRTLRLRDLPGDYR